MLVQPIPPGFHTITPYLVVKDAAKLIEFLRRILDAEVKHISKLPDGTIMHATVQIGDSMLMLTDACSKMAAQPAMLYLYVPNVDEVYERTVKAGVEWERAPVTQFYGDRAGCIKDHSGNHWWIASHVEDVSEEELQIRQQKMSAGGQPKPG